MPPSPEISKTNGSESGNQVPQSDRLFNKIATISCFSYVSLLLTIYMLIYEEVSEPYMDEIFHVQQVQSYCVHNFTYWNPKITTPPGLYFTTWVFFKPISELIAFGEDDPRRKCPMAMIRLMNLIFASANVYMIYMIAVKTHRYASRISKAKALFSAISLSTFPPLFFFNFLYYTDAGSLFFILAMYLNHLNGHQYLAAMFGFLSLFYRQTNIVWCGFLAAYSALKIIQSSLERSKKRARFIATAISSIPQILINLGGYILVAILFVVFLFYNNGIVLGDKSAHQATLHLAQIVYFLCFTSLFAAPWIVTVPNLKKFCVFCYTHLVTTCVALSALTLILKYQNEPHPYLLADNRHYTFYLWRRLFGNKNSLLRYAALPTCVLTLWSLFNLIQRKDTLWKCLYFLSVCLSILPQRLIEFRYFIPAFIIWRLNIASYSSLSLALEFALNIIINSLIIYIFLSYPFKWPNSHELQRFMW